MISWPLLSEQFGQHEHERFPIALDVVADAARGLSFAP